MSIEDRTDTENDEFDIDAFEDSTYEMDSGEWLDDAASHASDNIKEKRPRSMMLTGVTLIALVGIGYGGYVFFPDMLEDSPLSGRLAQNSIQHAQDDSATIISDSQQVATQSMQDPALDADIFADNDLDQNSADSIPASDNTVDHVHDTAQGSASSSEESGFLTPMPDISGDIVLPDLDIANAARTAEPELPSGTIHMDEPDTAPESSELAALLAQPDNTDDDFSAHRFAANEAESSRDFNIIEPEDFDAREDYLLAITESPYDDSSIEHSMPDDKHISGTENLDDDVLAHITADDADDGGYAENYETILNAGHDTALSDMNTDPHAINSAPDIAETDDIVSDAIVDYIHDDAETAKPEAQETQEIVHDGTGTAENNDKAVAVQKSTVIDNPDAVARAVTAKPQISENKQAGANQATQNTAAWFIRSAQPGKATLFNKNNQSSIYVETGDSVAGIGKITAIAYENGRWIVKGTQGSVAR